jgi:hypothetical protein
MCTLTYLNSYVCASIFEYLDLIIVPEMIDMLHICICEHITHIHVYTYIYLHIYIQYVYIFL